MANTLLVKRGTRAQLNAAAAASGLKAGEPYLITDEGRLAVGLSVSTYGEYALTGHVHPADTIYHGVESIGALSFDSATHVLTVAAATNKYWFQGTAYTTTSAITCDLDSYVTLTANTLYYVAFDAAGGVLKASASVWGLKSHVPVATVFWNGTAGYPAYEAHNHTRDLDWHAWAHVTVGARYGGGLALVAPTTANDAALSLGSGVIYDEDIAFQITAQTVARVWYKVSASVYTCVDSALPYAGASADPKYLDTDTYTLTSAGDSAFLNMWVYASTDISRPIYIIPTHASTTYNTIGAARGETPPDLSGLNLSPEMKLLYRFTYRGDGQFQESVDYRNSSVLPAGGTAAVTAASVAVVPAGDISATTVQTALEELDGEKQPLQAALTAIAALAVTDGNLIVGNGSTWVAESGATARTSLGLGTGDSPQFTAIELGAASDTTLARSAAGKMTIEGVEVTTTSNTQTLTNKTVTALKETKTTSSSYNFDLAAGNYFTHTASANNLTVSNVPATGTVASFIIELTNGGAYTFSFWVGSGGAPIKWAGGAVPALTASGVDLLGFYTHDGGTTWRGLLLAKDSK